jgi:hypothetical protein
MDLYREVTQGEFEQFKTDLINEMISNEKDFFTKQSIS